MNLSPLETDLLKALHSVNFYLASDHPTEFDAKTARWIAVEAIKKADPSINWEVANQSQKEP